MRGKRAKELRKMASFSISHDSEVKKLKEYLSAKDRYKSLKRAYKQI
jgi:hypothetical protein|tara:strand:- start:373 stop:513 length:141 start_codon:yes stop_codon:yes gene_type:complete